MIILFFIFKNKKSIIKVDDIIDYSPVTSQLSLFELTLLDLINYQRVNLGLNELIPENECRILAYKHTKYMIAENEVSHDFAFARKYELFRRGASLYGENVGYGYSSNQSFFNAYMKSEVHKNMIETKKFTHIGVRVLKSKDNKYYNTLIFATF